MALHEEADGLPNDFAGLQGISESLSLMDVPERNSCVGGEQSSKHLTVRTYLIREVE